LCFLGLGVAPEVPSWGNILSDGFDLIRITTLPLLVGGAPLVLATVGFTLFGEAVRDALDPKLGRGART
jgi:peptide/nickel transport system permease protein